MRIIHFIYGLRTGGAEALVRDYAIIMKKQGHEVLVLLTNSSEETPNKEALQHEGVKLKYLEADKVRFSSQKLSKIYRQLKVQHLVNQEINKFRPDIIHVHLNSLKYIALIPKCSAKIFYTVHNPPQTLFFQKREIWAAKKLIEQKRITFIAIQEDLATETNDFFNINNTLVIHNVIDINKYRMSIDKNKKKMDLGIPKDAFIIGHVGRFEEQKNHRFLIKVFQEVFKEYRNAYLILVGDGNLKAEIVEEIDRKQLSDNVKIFSNRGDVNEILSIMDRFVFPSVFEGFGIVLLEAQAAGVPCIVSDVVTDYVNVSDKFVKLSLSEPVKKWVTAIMNPKIAGKKKYDVEDYDIENITKKLICLYNTM